MLSKYAGDNGNYTPKRLEESKLEKAALNGENAFVNGFSTIAYIIFIDVYTSKCENS